MFEFSLLEGVIIGLVALLVLGPTKLLEISRVTGRWLGKLRRQFSDIKDEINREVEMEEMRKKLGEEERALREQMNVSAGVDLNENIAHPPKKEEQTSEVKSASERS